MRRVGGDERRQRHSQGQAEPMPAPQRWGLVATTAGAGRQWRRPPPPLPPARGIGSRTVCFVFLSDLPPYMTHVAAPHPSVDAVPPRPRDTQKLESKHQTPL